MIISTYTEYDKNGNITSQTTTRYDDDDVTIDSVCESDSPCRDECAKNIVEDSGITTEELFAIAMRSVGLIDTIRDPRVTQFMEALDDLLEMIGEDVE